jgi:uncharacterized membrane protein
MGYASPRASSTARRSPGAKQRIRVHLARSKGHLRTICQDGLVVHSTFSRKFCLTIARARALLISSQIHAFLCICPDFPGSSGSDRAWSIYPYKLNFDPEGANVPEETPSNLPQQQSAQSGLSDNGAGALAYLFIPAIIFLIVEPYNKSSFIKFHSWQSIFLFIAAFLINMVLGMTFILAILIPFVGLAFLVIAIICILKALKGERYKLPFIGDYAEKQAGA